MATRKTNRTAAGVPAQAQEKGAFYEIATYEATGAAGAAPAVNGDVIQAIQVPEGYTVVDIILDHDALGAGVTLAVSTTDDGGKSFRAAAAATAAGTYRKDAGTQPHTFVANGTLDVTVAGGTATGTITLTALLQRKLPA